MLPKQFYDSLFKFAFVRNPWDLQVSSYHHIQRERPHLLKEAETFDAFLRRKFDPERPWQYHIDTSITPQSDYLVDLKGNLIVDFIGKYETLQQDFTHCCQVIDIPTIELPHRRRLTIDWPIAITTRPNGWSKNTSPETSKSSATSFRRNLSLPARYDLREDLGSGLVDSIPKNRAV